MSTYTETIEGPVEADETFVDCKAKYMHASKRRRRTGRGGVDKVPVTGIKDRPTGKVKAMVVESTDGSTLRGFVAQSASDGATIYTDEAAAYSGLPNRQNVTHGVGGYVGVQAHINGMVRSAEGQRLRYADLTAHHPGHSAVPI